MKLHQYRVQIEWTGNTGEGTSSYQSYLRDFNIHMEGKAIVAASSDPAFRGDPTKMNPEEMLLSALSSCHMLWFLHECADHGLQVIEYLDDAEGFMEETPGMGGRFKEVILRPKVLLKDNSKLDLSYSLHAKAGKKCFIANSCNFPISFEPEHRIDA